MREEKNKEVVDGLSVLSTYLALARSIFGGRIGDYSSEPIDGNSVKEYLRLVSSTMDAKELPAGVTWEEHKKICTASPEERCPYMPDREKARIIEEKKKKAERGDESDMINVKRKEDLSDTIEFGSFRMPKFIVQDMMDRDGERDLDPRWQEKYEDLLASVRGDLADNGDAMTYVPDETASFLKSNQEYPQGSIDFVDICLKRELALGMMTDILRRHKNLEFDVEDWKIISDELKRARDDASPSDKRMVDWACSMCFVEFRREGLSKWSKKFIDCVNGGSQEDLKPKTRAAIKWLEDEIGKGEMERIGKGLSIYDLAVPEGNDEFFAREPKAAFVYEAFKKFNSSLGTGSQQLFDHPARYNGELVMGGKMKKGNSNTTVTKKNVDTINNNGGLRFWSKSDFDARFTDDIVRIVNDASRLGLKAQSYTKRDDWAYLMKDTGVKILRSGIPEGRGFVEASVPDGVQGDEYTDKNGVFYVRASEGLAFDDDSKLEKGKWYRLDFNGKEGIDFNDPNVMDSSGHPDIGCNVVGVNGAQMWIAQRDPRISQIIPLHGSKVPPQMKEMMINHGWNKPGRDHEMQFLGHTKEGREKWVAASHGNTINFYPEVLKPMVDNGEEITERTFVERYLELCHKKGVVPRCAYGLKRVGEWPQTQADKDAGRPAQPRYEYVPGYSKYLADGKMFDYRADNYGKYYPMRPIKANFDLQAIRDVIENRAGEIRRRRTLGLNRYTDSAERRMMERRG